MGVKNIIMNNEEGLTSPVSIWLFRHGVGGVWNGRVKREK